MNQTSKIYISNPETLAGKALVNYFSMQGFEKVLDSEIDLFDQQAVNDFFAAEKPDYAIIVSQKSGSIKANNTYPADFIYDNLVTQTNIMHAANANQVKKLLYLGASCVYPSSSNGIISENMFQTGKLEPTSLAYATAKIAGIIMAQAYHQQYGVNYISAIPATIYGPGDEFHPDNSHVLTSLINKFHIAKQNNYQEILLWGTGSPVREFIYTRDFADACNFLLNNYDSPAPINIGTAEGISIKDLAEKIKQIVKFQGVIKWDTSKPDGASMKVLDNRKIKSMSWKPQMALEDGIRHTYKWYLENRTTLYADKDTTTNKDPH